MLPTSMFSSTDFLLSDDLMVKHKLQTAGLLPEFVMKEETNSGVGDNRLWINGSAVIAIKRNSMYMFK